MAKTSVKDLKNINSFDKMTLAKWGIIGAIVLFAYALVTYIIGSIVKSDALWTVFSIIGLVLGILYLVLGIFGVISTVKSQEGKWWGFFLAGSILAILAPLAWFGIAGIVIAALAAAMFLTYIMLEKK